MQPCAFHLAFELLPVSHPTDHDGHQIPEFKPPHNLNLFSATLPAHDTLSWAAYFAPRQQFGQIASGKTPGHTKYKDSLRRRHCRSAGHAIDDKVAAKKDSRLPAIRESISQNGDGWEAAVEQDWRFDSIVVDTVDVTDSYMDGASQASGAGSAMSGASNSHALRGRYIANETKATELGEGVIHLYRDAEPTSQVGDVVATQEEGQAHASADDTQAYVDENDTTLCILAIPSYMSPSDLLGWLGEETRGYTSHLRLIRTGRSNRYMALLKFRQTEEAKKWQKCWNGKLFNSMEPENCHIVFVRSIRFQSAADHNPLSFPGIMNDPFTPVTKRVESADANPRPAPSLGSKPAPPPTPSLMELPTCPVCLERMDETNGLATIFCQHVFHCACLQKWRGSGCPVCRYTQSDPSLRLKCADDDTNECATCGAVANLWICLICGKVGCGRYDEAHAFYHFEQTSHRFAMDVATQHIWDYVGDEYVHRLIQNKSDGKLVELPPSTIGRGDNPDLDMMPRDKLENISLEYTYLLTSQLDSQRIYFEEQRDRAVDKACKAAAEAQKAKVEADRDRVELKAVKEAHSMLKDETLPTLERDRDRAQRRADKFEKMSREFERQWRDDKAMTESMMDRITHLERQVHEATLKNSDLEEQNRDLSFFISGMEKLKGAGEEVREGQVTVAEKAVETGKKKGKKKK